MDGRLTWTDCDEAGDYVVPNVLSPRDLVSRPDIMDETVPHVQLRYKAKTQLIWSYISNVVDASRVLGDIKGYLLFIVICLADSK